MTSAKEPIFKVFKTLIKNPMICGGCGETVEFSPDWAVRHWEAYARAEYHQNFNCLVHDGGLKYHVRVSIGGLQE